MLLLDEYSNVQPLLPPPSMFVSLVASIGEPPPPAVELVTVQ